MAYDAFISCSQAADEPIATALQSALQRFAKPWWKLREFNVFRDEAGLAASSDLTGPIRTTLDDARFFIVLASPVAASSPWLGRELSLWRLSKPSDHIIIALTEGTLAWSESTKDFDWRRTDALPRSLAGAFSVEPLCVDLAWIRDKDQLSPEDPRLQESVAKIAARLHGKSLDEIARDAVRERRIARWLSSGATLVITAIAVGACIAAWIAHAGQQRAQRNLDEAMLAVNRMQTSVAKDLDELAGVSTKLRIKMLGEVDQVLTRLDQESRTEEVQHSRAQMLTILAESFAAAGDVDAALERLDQALAILLRLAAKHPDDPLIVSDLAIAHSREGDMYSFHQKDKLAIGAYQASTAGLTRLIKQQPQSPLMADWRLMLFRNFIFLGDLYLDSFKKQGDLCDPLASCLAQAQSYFGEALDADTASLEKAPDDATWLNRKAVVEERLAEAYEAKGDDREAESALSTAQGIVTQLRAANPSDTLVQLNVSAITRKVGDIEQRQCKLSQALQSYQTALSVALPLHEIDPDRADWIDELSSDYQDVGQLEAVLGQTDAARTALEASLQWRKAALQKDPSNQDWQAELKLVEDALAKLGSNTKTIDPPCK